MLVLSLSFTHSDCNLLSPFLITSILSLGIARQHISPRFCWLVYVSSGLVKPGCCDDAVDPRAKRCRACPSSSTHAQKL